MSLTIELTPEETRRFEEAGINLTSFLKGIAANLPPEATARNGNPPIVLAPKSVAAIAYLEEKANRRIDDPDEIQRVERELDELQNRLNQNRIAAGETPLFPE